MENDVNNKLFLEHIMYDITYDDTIGDVYVDKIYYKPNNTSRAFTQTNPQFGKLPKKKIKNMNTWTNICKLK